MNAAEYERMYRLEDSYWWFVGRHRLIESLLRDFYGAPSDNATRGPSTRDNPPHDTPTHDTPTHDNPGRTILDVGCGTGAMSARLAKWGQVVSADFSPLALQFSRRRGLKHLVGADAMRLPFAEGCFDVLVAMDMLEHLPDDRAALCEFHRVLKPGGRVLATVPAYPHLWSEHDVALMHHRRYVRRQLAERFAACGLHVEKVSHTMTLLYPLVAMQRRLNAHKPPHNPPQAAMPAVPGPINAALTGLLTAENTLARHLDFPFGVTILCIATK